MGPPRRSIPRAGLPAPACAGTHATRVRELRTEPTRVLLAQGGPGHSPRHRGYVALFLFALACVGLAACGGSAGPAGNTAASASTPARTLGSVAARSATEGTRHEGSTGAKAGLTRFDTCLRKHGISVQAQSGLSGARRPKGVSVSHYRQALQACASASPASSAGNTPRKPLSPRFRNALVAFAACMRKDGVNLAAPNTTGKGPIFSTKGVDVRSVAFRTAERNCRSTLTAAATSHAGSAQK